MTAMTQSAARVELTPELNRYLEQSINAYRINLARVLARNGALTGMPKPEEVAEFGTQALPAGVSRLAAAVGPVYTTKSVMKLLSVTRQQVDDRRSRGTILALRTADGQWVYPAFQFEGHAMRPPVRALLDVFRAAKPDWWTVAAWMRQPRTEWGGKSAAELLAEDPANLPRVLPAADEAAARWAA